MMKDSHGYKSQQFLTKIGLIAAPVIVFFGLTAGAVPTFIDESPEGHPEKATPTSFTYVLQADHLSKNRAKAVGALSICDRDWIIIDSAFRTDPAEYWTPDDIAGIRLGKASRKVIAYLSIGEAEMYRPYWQKTWDTNHDGKPDRGSPVFLDRENPEWKGNYRVHYWNPEWQEIILKSVDRIIEQGFDGIYLDVVDGFETYEYDARRKDWIDHRVNPETSRTYRQDMIAWVQRLADYVRQRRPGMLIIPQNGVQLLENKDYLQIINAQGCEDLFTQGDKIRSVKDSEYRMGFLKTVRDTGKPILLIEYGKKTKARRRTLEAAQQHAMIPLLTDRELTTLGESTR